MDLKKYAYITKYEDVPSEFWDTASISDMWDIAHILKKHTDKLDQIEKTRKAYQLFLGIKQEIIATQSIKNSEVFSINCISEIVDPDPQSRYKYLKEKQAAYTLPLVVDLNKNDILSPTELPTKRQAVYTVFCGVNRAMEFRKVSISDRSA